MLFLSPGLPRTEELWPRVPLRLLYSTFDPDKTQTLFFREPWTTVLTRCSEGCQPALPGPLATPSLARVSTPAVQVEILGGRGRAWFPHSFPSSSHQQKGTGSEGPALPLVFQFPEEQVSAFHTFPNFTYCPSRILLPKPPCRGRSYTPGAH